MKNNTGIFNSRAFTNEYIRDLRTPPMPVRVAARPQVDFLVKFIENSVNWRAYCYVHGRLDSARTTAIMIGRKRAELRALLAVQS